jgi:hypothetical protein
MTAHLLDDTSGARRELAKLGPVAADENDIDLLQLHLDLNGDMIALADKLKLLDRVLALARSRADRLHYAAVKAIELTLAGDPTGAAATVDVALEEARASEEDSPFDPATEFWFCQALEVAGISKSNRDVFAEAAERLQHLIARGDHWTPLGLGNLYRCLGDVRRLGGQWEEGATAYATGFEFDGNPACRIFEASCRLMQGRPDEALAIIEMISFDELDVPERADFAIAYAAIAIALRDVSRLDDAAAKLPQVTPDRQYFAHQNTHYQLAIERARAAIMAGRPVPRSSRLLEWIGSLSRWLMIQPNIAGIGINLNNMVDDAVAAQRRKHDD